MRNSNTPQHLVVHVHTCMLRSVNSPATRFEGLANSSTNNTYLDGSPGAGGWWQAVGAWKHLITGQIPGFTGGAKSMELWIRVGA